MRFLAHKAVDRVSTGPLPGEANAALVVLVSMIRIGLARDRFQALLFFSFARLSHRSRGIGQTVEIDGEGGTLPIQVRQPFLFYIYGLAFSVSDRHHRVWRNLEQYPDPNHAQGLGRILEGMAAETTEFSAFNIESQVGGLNGSLRMEQFRKMKL